MKIKAPTTPAKRLRVPPPGRQRYVVELPANAELIVTCRRGFQICAGRISPGSYRVWPRKLGLNRSVEFQKDPWDTAEATDFIEDEPSGGPP